MAKKPETETRSLPLQYRFNEVTREQVNEETRTIELSFSSEEPYERLWGTEVLDHSPKSIRLGRLKRGGAVLVDHNVSDHVGVVEKVWISDDRMARASVRFGKGVRADEVFNDVKDGIRSNVSVGYRIHAMALESKKEDSETYRVTDWEPYEVSLVSVPADPTVGVGRAAQTYATRIFQLDKEQDMAEEAKPAPAPEPPKPAPAPDIRAIENEARETERLRVRQIQSIGERVNQPELTRQFVENGRTTQEFIDAIMDKMGPASPIKHAESADIGMSEREVKKFSFVRLIHALSNPTDRAAQSAAKFEFEASDAVRQKTGREARGALSATVPEEVLMHRDLIVATAVDGGNIVSTDLLAQNFIDVLRNRTAVARAGATMLPGLVGNVAIPSKTTAATAYWVAEGTAPTEGAIKFGQVTLAPKTLAAYVDFSRKLGLQGTPAIENLVRMDLVDGLGVEIDRAAINGAGTGAEPAGILASTSVGTTTGGANGLAPTWALMVELETLVGNSNADLGALAYMTNSKVRGKLKTVVKSTSAVTGFIWDMNTTPINGYGALVSNNVPSNLTKGTSTAICSAAIFANWNDLLIGMWGGLDLLVDPYTASNTGTVRVVAMQDVDVALRRVGSFAYIKDLLTT